MSVITSRAGHLTRRFSNGQLLKLPQTEEGSIGSAKNSDSLISRSAIVLSFLGFGFSAFSTQRLCDDKKPRPQYSLWRKP